MPVTRSGAVGTAWGDPGASDGSGVGGAGSGAAGVGSTAAGGAGSTAGGSVRPAGGAGVSATGLGREVSATGALSRALGAPTFVAAVGFAAPEARRVEGLFAFAAPAAARAPLVAGLRFAPAPEREEALRAGFRGAERAFLTTGSATASAAAACASSAPPPRPTSLPAVFAISIVRRAAASPSLIGRVMSEVVFMRLLCSGPCDANRCARRAIESSPTTPRRRRQATPRAPEPPAEAGAPCARFRGDTSSSRP